MSEWRYANTSDTNAGMMICITCQKKIIESDFRFKYSEQKKAYLTQHRDCCNNDPNWTKYDKQVENQIDEEEESMIDYKKLVHGAVLNARPMNNIKMTRWGCLAHILGCGSSVASQICVLFGKDPDEILHPKEIE